MSYHLSISALILVTVLMHKCFCLTSKALLEGGLGRTWDKIDPVGVPPLLVGRVFCNSLFAISGSTSEDISPVTKKKKKK